MCWWRIFEMASLFMYQSIYSIHLEQSPREVPKIHTIYRCWFNTMMNACRYNLGDGSIRLDVISAGLMSKPVFWSPKMARPSDIVASHFAAISQDSCRGVLPSLGSRFARSWLECSLMCIIGLVSNNYVCSSFVLTADYQLCHISHLDIRYENDVLLGKVFSRKIKVNSFSNVYTSAEFKVLTIYPS